MSSLIVAVGLLVFFAGSLNGQLAGKEESRHCLWKVQGQTNTVHIFGSIHFLKKEFYPLAKPIEDAYEQAQIIVFEADFDQMESPQTELKILQQGKYPDGETLKQHLSEKTYAMLQSHSGVASPAFDSFKPWMVAVALTGIELQKLGFNPEQGVDKHFFAMAKRDKKQILPLETVDFQLGLFTGFSDEEQDAMLKETIEEVSGFKKILTDMTDAWKVGDAKKLDQLTLDELRKYPQLQKKLLLDRNKQWVGRIEKLLAGGKNVFVVVGAAHLVGQESVVDLLSRKGFKVQQL